MESKSVLLVGVGGQGAILTAKILVNGLISEGYDVKMSEVHGMSQRGGSVSTQVHFGKKVNSPVIGLGAADIAMESSTTAAGLAQYPEGCVEAMQAHFKCHVLNAEAIAESLGSTKCMNVVLFGGMVKALGMDDIDWEKVVAETVPPKFRELNLKAYRAGYAAVV